ncbi:SET domain-containing protein 4-like [Tubulanus polymorphus]|uniref:SET domain-containing protein 4-like n=1 Tax=Tubulanus polymorphus TaxID=672921 RepID=UPI003DA33AFC
MSSCGRTKRIRKRKLTRGYAISKSHEPCYVQLLKFTKHFGFQRTSHLRPAEFRDTGRGLMTLGVIQEGDLVVAIPEALLITTKTALQSPFIKGLIERCGPLTPVQVLCIFLIREKQLEERSRWFPYIDMLLLQYSTPAYFTDSEIAFLPMDIRWKSEELKFSILSSFNSLASVILEIAKLDQLYKTFTFTYDDYLWAWHVVNTRCVYMLQEKSPYLTNDVDHYALAPFLDLLNHSAAVKVEANFNVVTRCYEIRSLVNFPRYSQVFICYGPHDNGKLLLEYGFILPLNPHNAVIFQFDDITSVKQKFKIEVMDKKLRILHEKGLKDFHCSLEGCSWDLLKACEILSLDYDNLLIWKPHVEMISFKHKADQILQFLMENRLTSFLDIHSQLSRESLTDNEKMILQLYDQYITILKQNLKTLEANMQPA